jgi:hypothetical protein
MITQLAGKSHTKRTQSDHAQTMRTGDLMMRNDSVRRVD